VLVILTNSFVFFSRFYVCFCTGFLRLFLSFYGFLEGEFGFKTNSKASFGSFEVTKPLVS
jgi:hypothetical protein